MDLDLILNKFNRELNAVISMDDLILLKNKYLGKKGEVKLLMKDIAAQPPSEKIAFAARVNDLNNIVELSLENTKEKISNEKIANQINKEWIDLSMPGIKQKRGGIHPLSEIERKCIRFLANIGFEYVDGPEIETPFYNFDALNIPKHHPAREMQDTFWLENDLLLRSHTSTVQIRAMEEKQGKLPVKIISPGRVYRNEAVDAIHLSSFHQFEGLHVDRNITFGDLKGTLEYIIYNLFDKELWEVRFKPKFYPYTEPSVGVDVALKNVTGKKRQWITILGAGMVHPNVFRALGYDPSEVSGFAFGLGISRIVAQVHDIRDMKSLYELDLRVHQGIAHKQFA